MISPPLSPFKLTTTIPAASSNDPTSANLEFSSNDPAIMEPGRATSANPSPNLEFSSNDPAIMEPGQATSANPSANLEFSTSLEQPMELQISSSPNPFELPRQATSQPKRLVDDVENDEVLCRPKKIIQRLQVPFLFLALIFRIPSSILQMKNLKKWKPRRSLVILPRPVPRRSLVELHYPIRIQGNQLYHGSLPSRK